MGTFTLKVFLHRGKGHLESRLWSRAPGGSSMEFEFAALPAFARQASDIHMAGRYPHSREEHE